MMHNSEKILDLHMGGVTRNKNKESYKTDGFYIHCPIV
jgi:hypothetical protein